LEAENRPPGLTISTTIRITNAASAAIAPRSAAALAA
jgi:hypothetical protein